MGGARDRNPGRPRDRESGWGQRGKGVGEAGFVVVTGKGIYLAMDV